MDDSSVFMQWAMEMLQHENPPAAATYGAVQQELPVPEPRNGMVLAGAAAQDGATHSRRNTWTGAVGENDCWWPRYPPLLSRNIPSTMAERSTWWPTAPARLPNVPRASSSQVAAGKEMLREERRPEPCVQGRPMAQRKRRETINSSLIERSTVIAAHNKMDAVRYVQQQQQQQQKHDELEGRLSVTTIDSVLLVKRQCIATIPDGARTTRSSLPEIEARIWDSTVMVRIHCEDGKGVLVRLLAEIEALHLSITHTNVMPFPACTVNITIMAKVDEGFNIAPEDIVGMIDAAFL